MKITNRTSLLFSLCFSVFLVISWSKPCAARTNAVSMQVYYATDRQREGGNINPKYTKKRRYAAGMEYGQCKVTLPTSASLSEYYTTGFKPVFVSDGKAKVDQIKDQAKEPESFFADLKERFERSKADRIVVFVHGYNNGMDVALQRAAELSLDFKCPAVAYSWPSNEWLLDYVKDECNVEWSLPHFRRFLEELEARFGAEHITIVAHSMGNRLLMWALNARSEKAAASKIELTKYPDIILSSPDIDSGTFKNYAVSVCQNSDESWLFISSRDKALPASSFLHGRNRLGRSSEDGVDIDWRQPPAISGLKTIEFSILDKALLGHSVPSDLIARVARRGIEGSGVKLLLEKSLDGKYSWYRVVK